MEREEQFRRNLKHAFEFIEGLIDFPEQQAKLPDGSNVVSMPTDDPELCTANEDMMRVASPEQTEGYVRGESLRSLRLGRKPRSPDQARR
jgi:hypothetical protein